MVTAVAFGLRCQFRAHTPEFGYEGWATYAAIVATGDVDGAVEAFEGLGAGVEGIGGFLEGLTEFAGSLDG